MRLTTRSTGATIAPGTTKRSDMSTVNGSTANGNGSLPLSPDDIARALRPLEAASMLPPAAFVDQAVFDWEMRHLFAGGWICLGHVSQVEEQGKFIRREIGPDSVVVVGGEDGRPHAF